MTLSLPCATFARLANAALRPTDQFERVEFRPFLACIRIEITNGRKLAIATNSVIMAVENLGLVDGVPDASFNIAITDTLLERCKAEAGYNSVLTVANLQAVTTMGYREMSVGAQQYVDWRKAIPSGPPKKQSDGVMFDTEQVYRLCKSAPSGEVVTQSVFNRHNPVICRDAYDDNWCGVFFSREKECETAAVRPEWLE